MKKALMIITKPAGSKNKGEKQIMKFLKFKLVTLFLLLLIFAVIFTGCSPKYLVIAYTVETSLLDYQYEQLAFYKGNDHRESLIESRINKILNNPRREEFEAKKIIDYTSTSVRFIDSQGKEKFIAADKVEIKNIKDK